MNVHAKFTSSRPFWIGKRSISARGIKCMIFWGALQLRRPLPHHTYHFSEAQCNIRHTFEAALKCTCYILSIFFDLLVHAVITSDHSSAPVSSVSTRVGLD